MLLLPKQGKGFDRRGIVLRYNYSKLQGMKAKQAAQAQQQKDAERADIIAEERMPILQPAVSGTLTSKSPKSSNRY